MIVSLGSAGQISGREYRPDTHLSQTLKYKTNNTPPKNDASAINYPGPRVQHRFQNITCRAGQADPYVFLPRHPVNIVSHLSDLRCKDSVQNITCRMPSKVSYKFALL